MQQWRERRDGGDFSISPWLVAAAGSNPSRDGEAAVANLTVAREQVVVSDFDGFGAQYNNNVYAERSRSVGVSDANVRVMEERVGQLAPQLARVFFNADALRDGDLLQSFRRTVRLAQTTAGAINITLQGLGPNVLEQHPQLMRRFAEEVAGLLAPPEPISKLKWITLRNEPNGSSPIAKDLYARCYREFDAELQRLGIASRVAMMGGDLLQNNQREWFTFLANDRDLRRILKAYSIHVYWQFDEPAKIDTRLRDVSQIRASLPAVVKNRPFYVMECGARGAKEHGGVTEDPGFFTGGSRICETNVNAFQRVWFALQAARRGFAGVVAWDAFFAKYDLHAVMHYSLIGAPTDPEPWPLRPAYRALRLLSRAVEPGWSVLRVSGGTETQLVVAFADPSDQSQMTIVGLDKAGGGLNTKTTRESTYTISGVPASTEFQLCLWNKTGNGRNSFDDRATSNSQKTVTIRVPLHCAFVLTTRRLQ